MRATNGTARMMAQTAQALAQSLRQIATAESGIEALEMLGAMDARNADAWRASLRTMAKDRVDGAINALGSDWRAGALEGETDTARMARHLDDIL